MDKKALQKAVNQIQNPKIRDWIEMFLETQVPDYFWEMPASTTGKYHPEFALGEGGVVRHTRVAVHIALELIDNGLYKFDELERDIILSALILHDTFKKGKDGGQYSVADHGVQAAEAILDDWQDAKTIRGYIAQAVASHMGQWNKDYKTDKIVAPKPANELQKFVHLCDYLASRKVLEVDTAKLLV